VRVSLRTLRQLPYMIDSNKPLRLPIDPYLYNASDAWWKTYKDLYEDAEESYSQYQGWMREQGVIIRNVNNITDSDQGLDFIDSESMTLFVLRWA
jgi:hypothetical protein